MGGPRRGPEPTRDPALWVRWADLPQIGAESDPEHAATLRGAAFADLDLTSERGPDEPEIYVQEVYVMDGFMRALAEFRSPQAAYQVTVPIPCLEDEPLENVKRRLFDQARANFVALQSLPMAEKLRRYGPEGDARRDLSAWIRAYKWIGTFFGPDWTEDSLKWFVYQDYDSFLDPDLWEFYGPDLSTPTPLFDELKLAKPTSLDAIYLLPTHLRVVLWRAGYDRLMFTLPRETSFETLKDLVEADLGLQPGTFTKFDCGAAPGHRFGPGKTFADVLPPTTVGVSREWA